MDEHEQRKVEEENEMAFNHRQWEHNQNEGYFPDEQSECPFCNSTEIDFKVEPTHDGGGNFSGDCRSCWCNKCEEEWLEPYEPDMHP